MLQANLWGVSPFQSPVSTLVKDPNSTFETVLSSQHFSQGFHQQNDDLLDFLVKDENMQKIVEFSLTDMHKEMKDYVKYTRLCVAILSTAAPKFQALLSTNGIFINSLVGFKDTPYAKDPILCGNFSRLVIFIIRFTSGEILDEKLSFLADFLIKNLNLLGLQELFISLCTEFAVPFHLSEELILKIIDQFADPILGYHSMLTIHYLMHLSDGNEQLFWRESIVRPILEEGISRYSTNPLFSLAAFKVVREIIFHPDQDAELKYLLDGKTVDFNIEVNCATSIAIELFPDGIPFLLDRFFAGELNTFINDKIVSVLTTYNIDKLIEFASNTHVCYNAIKYFDSYSQHKTNGHYLDLVRVFSEKGVYCCKEHRKLCSTFIKEKVVPRYRLVMLQYGGSEDDTKRLQTELFASIEDLYSLCPDDD